MVVTASFMSPTSGWMAPRRPSMPACECPSCNQGANSRWCLAAEPKSQRCGLPSRARRAYRDILSPSAPPIQVWVV